jgi:hypothetical protein
LCAGNFAQRTDQHGWIASLERGVDELGHDLFGIEVASGVEGRKLGKLGSRGAGGPTG